MSVVRGKGLGPCRFYRRRQRRRIVLRVVTRLVTKRRGGIELRVVWRDGEEEKGSNDE